MHHHLHPVPDTSVRWRLPRPVMAMVAVLLLASGLGGVAGSTQLSESSVVLETTFDPESPTAGDALTVQTLITIDPEGATDDESLVWTVTLSEIVGLEITVVACGDTVNTSCESTWEEGDATVVFSGMVEELTADTTTAEVTITGTIADDAEQVAAETCAVSALLTTGATPDVTPDATPDPTVPCEGESSSIDVAVVPPVAPTEEPTEEPTVVPTEEPTVVPTEEPTEPTATATSEPSATVEPTATATATSEPTATTEPTHTSTSESTATVQLTATTVTSEPTATTEPTQTPVVEPTPTEDNSDGGSDLGLWIGVGALIVLAGAAGVVWNQRRNTP